MLLLRIKTDKLGYVCERIAIFLEITTGKFEVANFMSAWLKQRNAGV